MKYFKFALFFFFINSFFGQSAQNIDDIVLDTTTDIPTTNSSTPGNNLCNGTECDFYAYCDMSNGTARCQCYGGYTGNGTLCTDLDECYFNSSDCPQRCMNSFGSYFCQCFDGYTGDGYNCTQLPSVNFTTTTRPFTFPTTPETNFTTPFTNTTSSPPNNTGPFVPNIVCPSSYLQCSYRAAWLCDYIQWKIDFVGLFLPSFDEWRQWDVLSGGYYSTTYFPCDYISVTCRNPYQYDYFHGPNYCHIPYCRDGYYEDVSANNLHSWIQDQYRWRSIYNSYRQLLVSSRNRCRP